MPASPEATAHGDPAATGAAVAANGEGSLETKGERTQNDRCAASQLYSVGFTCRSAFTPAFDAQFGLKTAGGFADRVKVDVDYDTTQVEVDDLVNVSVSVEFNPPLPMEAGMMVVDVSVPTGFSPVTETIAEAVQKNARIKRYDVAGRKVIFYVENMNPGDKISFGFKVRAMYPVKAKGVTSQAYSYYKPEIRAETLGKDVTVN